MQNDPPETYLFSDWRIVITGDSKLRKKARVPLVQRLGGELGPWSTTIRRDA
jgi:hypothetical protein